MDVLSLENLIVLRTDIHNGRPTIGGTGVTVRTVVGHYKLGLTAEEISDEMGLDLAGVYAALAYYHLNRNAIEADISMPWMFPGATKVGCCNAKERKGGRTRTKKA